jgi:hypothetical protein
MATLNAIHEAGVLHGDMHLSDLRVTSGGDVRITNFSDARMDVDVFDVDAFRKEQAQLRLLLLSLVTRTEGAEVYHFHRTRPLVPESSQGGGRYFEVRPDLEEGEGEDAGWSQETGVSLVIND